MAHKALIAIDASAVSRELIGYSFDYASKAGIEKLHFIHIIERPYLDPTGMPYLSELPKENVVEEEYREIIEGKRRSSGNKKMPYDITIKFGVPYDEIIRTAEKGKYDIILIGHRGMSNLKRFFIGSVAAKVAGLAPCDVLVFQPRGTTGKHGE